MAKKYILFLAPYPEGQAPSQRFRFEQYFQVLEEHGLRYDFEPFLDDKAWFVLYKPGNIAAKIWGVIKGFYKRKALMLRLMKYDFIFIHREVAPLGPPIFEWVIAKIWKKRIIYDFDDAIWLPNTSDSNLLAASLKWHRKVGSICKWSYKISCGNEYLARFAKQYNNNVVVNPTTIDTENLHRPVKSQESNTQDTATVEKPIIGWTGSHSTLPYLKLIEPALQQLENRYSFTFKVISNLPPDLDLKSLVYVPWKKSSEITDLQEFDIGVMPLENDKWAQGKCGFKCLQYMAIGIPALVSPIGVNNTIINHGVEGFFCESTEDWVHYMEILLQDASLRKKMGNNGRRKIKEQYSVQSNSENFISLFQ